MRYEWSAEALSASEQGIALGKKFNVNSKLSDQDYIFNSLIYSRKEDVAAAYEQYIADGRRNAEQVKRDVDAYLPVGGVRPPAPIRVLDFAAGYARVTRHFKNVAPEWSVAAADIHPEAKAFNMAEFGLDTFMSTYTPSRLAIPRNHFDVVVCLSFFSHVREEKFAAWLRSLLLLLKRDGILMITTHGEDSLPFLGDMKLGENGYGMLETSEQFDIPTQQYVHACTTRHFVEAQLRLAGGGVVEVFQPKAWWGHQDLYVIRRKRPESIVGRLKEAYRPPK